MPLGPLTLPVLRASCVAWFLAALTLAHVAHAEVAVRGNAAWLGVTVAVSEASDDAPVRAGAEVTVVDATGPAHGAGVRPGDRITGVGAVNVRDARDLGVLLAARAPGDVLALVLQRGDAELRNVKVKLGSWPERPAIAPGPPPAARADVPSSAVFSWGGRRSRACLGVECLELTAALARYLGSPPGEGVLIDAVVSDTPAEAAGLLAGDVLLAVDGDRLASVTGLADALGRRRPGQGVHLDLVRSGLRRQIRATLMGCDVPTWVLESPWPQSPAAPEVPELPPPIARPGQPRPR